jgi:arylsulfatase A-like enzyme
MACATADASDRPNILWITSEDNTASFMRLYNPEGVEMPNLERLSDDGIVFDRAFSNAPVCSVARSALISGTYGPRTATHQHRRVRFAPLPGRLRLFPHYLRRAGYFTSNNVKTDYNFADLSPWSDRSDKATWRGRESGQPFFHVQNHTTTHEHKLHFTEEEFLREPTLTDPRSVSLWPFHPDTPLMRHTYALYHDQHRILDREIGRLVDELTEEGLIENTIIFYFSDHGGVLPGSKGYLHEVGLQVPLVVWFPERWRHLSPMRAGTRWKGFVNFVDLAPTVLNLAGVPIPPEMDGRPFLGLDLDIDELAERDEALAYADRFDEKHDFSRSIRKGDWKYIRNYQPWMPDSLQNNYRYKMLAYREWRDLHEAGQLNAVQSAFFEPKDVEELYHLESDPYETRNLSDSTEHGERLIAMRELLRARLLELPDLAFIPEPVLLLEACFDPVAYGRDNRERIETLAEIVDLALEPGVSAVGGILDALESEDPMARFWAITAAISREERSARVTDKIKERSLSDAHRLVRIRAAEFRTVVLGEECVSVFEEVLKQAETAIEASFILNQAVVLMDHYGMVAMEVDSDMFPVTWRSDPVLAPRLEYLQRRSHSNGSVLVGDGSVNSSNTVCKPDFLGMAKEGWYNNYVFNNETTPTQYTLTVTDGSGDGLYKRGTMVGIYADTPPEGQEFDQWTGDIAQVAQPNSAVTTITVNANTTITATYTTLVSIDNANKLTLGSPYPNPTSDWLIIPEKGNVKYSAVLMDITGKIVGQWYNLSGKEKINCSHYTAGIYQLKISSEKMNKHFSVLIED